MGKQTQANTGLTPKQNTFLQALLAGNTIVASAKIAGCNETTAHAWLKLPHVQTAYRDAQREVFEASLTTLKLASHDAVQTLTSLMKSDETPAGARIRSAQILLDHAVQLHKIEELEERIAELEEAVKARAV